MTVFEDIKSKSVDELVEWLDECIVYSPAPWDNWFDEKYCSKCQSEIAWSSELCRNAEFAYCELHNKCRFFEHMDKAPNAKQIVKMWLEREC